MEGEARYRGENCVFWWMVAGRRGGGWIGEVVFFLAHVLSPSSSIPLAVQTQFTECISKERYIKEKEEKEEGSLNFTSSLFSFPVSGNVRNGRRKEDRKEGVGEKFYSGKGEKKQLSH